MAGLILRSLQDAHGEDLGIRAKLEAIGFGFLIPIIIYPAVALRVLGGKIPEAGPKPDQG